MPSGSIEEEDGVTVTWLLISSRCRFMACALAQGKTKAAPISR
jgi:hypothetical protein